MPAARARTPATRALPRGRARPSAFRAVFWLALGLAAGGAASAQWLAPPPAPSPERACPDRLRAAQGARAALERARPRGAYLVVDVRGNRFALHAANGTRLRSGRCSTGSEARLRAADGREWVFRTPRGARHVHAKSADPLWKKPDWAYVESGESIPASDAPERFEAGVLGAYALALGEGYFVHGTPYRLGIGRSITHGCVRLLDDDLRAVFETLHEGDAVLLF